MYNKITGGVGEARAYNYLKSIGYQIVDYNYTNSLGEIDIIAKDGDYLVFVEVKNRTSGNFGLPREAVTYTKQQKIRQVATLYLKQKKLLSANCRFDVIEVYGGLNTDKLEHLKNCF